MQIEYPVLVNPYTWFLLAGILTGISTAFLLKRKGGYRRQSLALFLLTPAAAALSAAFIMLYARQTADYTDCIFQGLAAFASAWAAGFLAARFPRIGGIPIVLAVAVLIFFSWTAQKRFIPVEEGRPVVAVRTLALPEGGAGLEIVRYIGKGRETAYLQVPSRRISLRLEVLAVEPWWIVFPEQLYAVISSLVVSNNKVLSLPEYPDKPIPQWLPGLLDLLPGISIEKRDSENIQLEMFSSVIYGFVDGDFRQLESRTDLLDNLLLWE
ncbi:MAG: hypothetical protein K9L68_05950 [Spirochaetales bacterium]|nr:hypothetical protein [Spirochaetales bacterium]MCF7938124.1 hypothetical protein [Spirochaetales bacterium]